MAIIDREMRTIVEKSRGVMQIFSCFTGREVGTEKRNAKTAGMPKKCGFNFNRGEHPKNKPRDCRRHYGLG